MVFPQKMAEIFSPWLREMSGLWAVKGETFSRREKKKKQLVLITAVVHIRKPYTAKSNLSQRLRCFPFILLVITVETSLPAFLLLIWDKPLVFCFVYPSLVIALDVLKQQLCSKWRQTLPVIDCDR